MTKNAPTPFFALLGDVSDMTIPLYQSEVVGVAAAASPGAAVKAFVVVPPNTAPFVLKGVFNNAGVNEYVNVGLLKGGSYVPIK